MLNQVFNLLENCSTSHSKFPPTDLYNEGWMLRVILDWFYIHNSNNHELTISSNCDWYSEAELPSTFLPRYRGDKFSEGRTHADGVIGKFRIGETGDVDFSLQSVADHFVVTEAKMFSKLSPKTTHASYYNQAARNVACIAEVIRKAGLLPVNFNKLSFYVIAPETRINEGIFSQYMEREHIWKTVKRRVDGYDEPKQEWFESFFVPTWECTDIRCLSWEEIISFIIEQDPAISDSLNAFYDLCLKYNLKIAKKYD